MYSRLKNILEELEENLMSLKKDNETSEIKEKIYQSGIWDSMSFLWNEAEKEERIHDKK